MILDFLNELLTTFTYSLLLLFSLFRAWVTNLVWELQAWIPEWSEYEEYLPPLDIWIYAACFSCLVLLHARLRRAKQERDVSERLEEGVYVVEKGEFIPGPVSSQSSHNEGRLSWWTPTSPAHVHDFKPKMDKLSLESQRHWSPPAYPWPFHAQHEA
ncbi:hypothetical protein BKA70DRAFT_1294810 [Coprinopsis sp. MPI-PUGE-AT-0042]|nr:hypothetical protein BKA70DRAFT_1294810 [Coprinopsis sp. MPI-PUGE-AT-0042]